MRLPVLGLMFCLPHGAQAACTGETLLACNIGDMALEVCLAGETLTYAFGPPEAPDIRLSEPLSRGTYTPWNGIGSTIFESVTFRNAGYAYDVFTSFDRMTENAKLQTGVAVFQGSDVIATLTCDTVQTAMPFDFLYETMEMRGYCWNRTTFAWVTDCG